MTFEIKRASVFVYSYLRWRRVAWLAIAELFYLHHRARRGVMSLETMERRAARS